MIRNFPKVSYPKCTPDCSDSECHGRLSKYKHKYTLESRDFQKILNVDLSAIEEEPDLLRNTTMTPQGGPLVM
jgi:hypothetical protein